MRIPDSRIESGEGCTNPGASCILSRLPAAADFRDCPIPLVHFYGPPNRLGAVGIRGFVRGWTIRLVGRTGLVHCNLSLFDRVYDVSAGRGFRVGDVGDYQARAHAAGMCVVSMRAPGEPELSHLVTGWPGIGCRLERWSGWPAACRCFRPDSPIPMNCVTITRQLLGLEPVSIHHAATPDGLLAQLIECQQQPA